MQLNDIVSKLVDHTGRKIQCGFAKGSEPKFLSVKEALKTPYIRFGNEYFIPALSLDIDTHKNSELVLSKCKELNIPLPTMIVDTTKGIHIHWVLENPISLNNIKAKYFYQQVISSLVIAFSTDSYAVPKNAGRLFRNPLKHKTTLHNDTLINLKPFSELAETVRKTKVKRKAVKSSGFSHYKKPDFSKITEGGRNSSLFDYGRVYAYRYAKAKNLKENLTTRLLECNSVLPQPLSNNEIDSIVSSIISFIKTKYSGKTTKVSTIEFNRKNAKRAYDKVHKKMLEDFYGFGILTVKDLSSMSLRQGAVVFGVHKNTYKKHLQDLINDIKLEEVITPVAFWNIAPSFPEVFTNTAVVNTHSYNPVLGCVNIN